VDILQKSLIEELEESARKFDAEAPRGHRPIEWKDREVEKPEWIVEGLIPIGVGIIGAKAKSYKSFLMSQLCASVSEGMDFLGFPTKKGTCIYFDLEQDSEGTAERLEMQYGKAFRKFDNFVMYNQEDNIKRLGQGFEEQFEAIIKKDKGVKLAVIDVYQCIRPIRPRGVGYQEDYTDLSTLNKLAIQHKMAIIVVHHFRKQTDTENLFDNFNGSEGLNGATAFMMAISKADFDNSAIIGIKGRRVPEQKFVAHFDTEIMRWVNEGTEEHVAYVKFKESNTMKTITAILEKQNSWNGTASDLITSADALGFPIEYTERELAKYLNSNLREFRNEGITITYKKPHNRCYYTIRQPRQEMLKFQ